MAEDNLLDINPALPPHIFTPAQLTARVLADIQERRAFHAAGISPGASSGLPKLDEALGGYMPAGVYMFHGVPGSGKTALVLQTATTCGTPSLFVTCEMSPDVLWTRVAARTGPIALRDLRFDGATPMDRIETAFSRTLEAAGGISFADARQNPLPYEKLRSELLRTKTPYGAMVIDSLHAWALSSQQSKTEYEALNTAVDQVRALAAEFNIPILVVAERNRASMQTGGLSAVAGTRRVEYGCDCMLELKIRDEEVPERTPGFENHMVNLTLKISKNRFGPPGVQMPLRFSLSLQKFHEAI